MSRRLTLAERVALDGEVPDPRPVELSGSQRPVSLKEELQRFIRQEVSKVAESHGAGSFEEEDDFDDDDGEDVLSPFEDRVRQLVDEATDWLQKREASRKAVSEPEADVRQQPVPVPD